jgi:hypothetical protein
MAPKKHRSRPIGRRAAPLLSMTSPVVLGALLLLSSLLVAASDQTGQPQRPDGPTAERSSGRAVPAPITPHTKIGKPSNGAFTLSDTPNLGDDWYFSKATGSGYLVDGHRYLAHTGVQVDREVWLTRDDVAEGRDTVVAAAVRWIEGDRVRRPTRRVRP